MSSIFSPINLTKWIDENRHLLKPPVGNKEIFEEGEFIVMVVGGPNSRKDYHYNETPEFFHQIEGDIIVKIIDNGTPRDISIKQGEIFLLPGKVPHSPQRGPNTIGIVIEQKRPASMEDALEWYCEKCGDQLYRETFPLKNIVTELPVLMNKFYADDSLTICKSCGHKMEAPQKAI
jgi:3-hydroxyanthranilate 3,4-dioxygenase